ncbi:MAG: lytic transglycosylase domain-containing protein [Thermoanaerobaculia bacterium]|nr:lytic transglycosylase domain-containing protein [Thermoanaerobaculia bacterium]
MKIDKHQFFVRALLTGALVLTSVGSAGIAPVSPVERPEPPTPEEVRILDELLEWVSLPPSVVERRSRLRPTLTGAVLARPQSFDLFRTFHDRDARLRLLDGIPFAREIRRAATRFEVDGLLIAAVIEAESGFNPEAVSVDGARGLMQVMPGTALLYGYEEYDAPAVNIEVGARYLAWLLREFDGDVALAVAAYNAGPGTVSRFDGVPPFGETRHYLERVLSRYVGYHQQLWRDAGHRAWLHWDGFPTDELALDDEPAPLPLG